LRDWRSYVISVIRAGIKARKIRQGLSKKGRDSHHFFAQGAIMLYRLERN